jgi:hypothetical protein
MAMKKTNKILLLSLCGLILLLSAGITYMVILNRNSRLPVRIQGVVLSTDPAEKAAITVQEIGGGWGINSDRYFKTKTPLDLLNDMKENPKGVLSMSIMAVPEGWIKAEHVDELIKLVNSVEPCASVVSPLSSFLPQGGSTIGVEAMFLIEGFKTGHYPPGLHSGQVSGKDPESYKQWWKEIKEQGLVGLYTARQDCTAVYYTRGESLSREVTPDPCYTVHSMKELLIFTDGLSRRICLWIDKSALVDLDKDWLYQKAVKERYPVLMTGCGNSLYAFRDLLGLYPEIHGPAIPREQKNKDGFSAFLYQNEIRTESSLTIRSICTDFPSPYTAADVLKVTKILLDGGNLFQYRNDMPPEEKVLHYYWWLKSDPEYEPAKSSLIQYLPLSDWQLLYNMDMDAVFEILEWLYREARSGDDQVLLSFLKSRTGLDAAPAEGYFSRLADLLQHNPARFVQNLAQLPDEDVKDIVKHLRYEVSGRKEIAKSLNAALLQSGLSDREKDVLRQLLDRK